MSLIRPWALWRRIQYGLGFFLFWLVVGAAVYYTNFYQPANCFDLTQNGDERGVDCGGACVRICAADVVPPRVVWAKSFEITEGQYNAVAYIENPNPEAATAELTYTFELLHDGEVVETRSGTTILPPKDVYPVFEGKILVDAATPITDTNLILDTVSVWQPATVGRDQFRSFESVLSRADTSPRLDAQIENTALVPAENVEVVATIFNDGGVPVTASQTFIEQIDARTTQGIVFTWPHSIAKTVRSCEVPTDVALGIDLSGSMNNDGGDPPQPVTAALQAAAQFTNNLNSRDQVALVTFATKAATPQTLTNEHAQVATVIRNLGIDPAEERGYTNTVSALRAIAAELDSERHNPDARRVGVLLTDGLPTAATDTDVVAEAVAAAGELRAKNIELYAIGLGEGVDRSFIEHIASDAGKVYVAPSGADLERIYKEITSSLCEVGPTKVDVIAKTQANFTPLR